MHTIYHVQQFHQVFGHPVANAPTVPDAKTRLLRFRLIFEETMEFGRSIGVEGLCEGTQEEFEAKLKEQMAELRIVDGAEVNLAEAADALGDIDYVVQGANLVFGFPAEAISREIHAANMSKLGEDGLPIKDAFGKIVKGPYTRKPDIARVLAEYAESRDVADERRIWGPK